MQQLTSGKCHRRRPITDQTWQGQGPQGGGRRAYARSMPTGWLVGGWVGGGNQRLVIMGCGCLACHHCQHDGFHSLTVLNTSRINGRSLKKMSAAKAMRGITRSTYFLIPSGSFAAPSCINFAALRRSNGRRFTLLGGTSLGSLLSLAVVVVDMATSGRSYPSNYRSFYRTIILDKMVMVEMKGTLVALNGHSISWGDDSCSYYGKFNQSPLWEVCGVLP